MAQTNPNNESSFKQLSQPQQLYKFGGSSLANAKAYKKVARIISKHLQENDLVVVSASGQTTDWLTKLVSASGATNKINNTNIPSLTDKSVKPELQRDYLLRAQYHHQGIIHDLLSEPFRQKLLTDIETNCRWINRLIELDQVSKFESNIIAFGEIWSAKILCALLEQWSINASWIDARQFLKLENTPTGYQLNKPLSFKYLEEHLKSRQQRLSIITGFIASDCDGGTITLGRNGSDYSATLVASLLDIEKVTLWTDVAGVFDFDPNLSDDASTIKHLNLNLIQELSDLGSPVLHSKTLKPLSDTKIKLSIRSTFSPELKGSKICQKNSFSQQSIVTHKNNLIQLHIECQNELACHKLNKYLKTLACDVNNEFSLFAKNHTHHLTIVIGNDRKLYWQNKLQQIKTNPQYSINKISDHQPTSFLALVTDKQNTEPCLSATLPSQSECRNLYHLEFFNEFLNGKNIKAPIYKHNNALLCFFNQPSLNSLTIDSLAIDCFHQWQAYQNTTALYLLGTGNVGSTWLKQWQDIQVKEQSNPNIISQQLVLTANSKTINLRHNDKDFATLENNDSVIEQLLKHSPFKHKVVIDATASEQVSNHYATILNNGIHLISANKICSSSDLTHFKYLQQQAKSNTVLWLQNATLGAGLPINYAIKNLLNCGDRIFQIRGVFSGTLSWLLNNYNGEQSFMALVKQAQSEGYSEPDPRIDLSGKDVARKLVIAARLAGFDISLNDIDCQPLIDNKYLQHHESDFWDAAEQINSDIKTLWQDAHNNNKTLVYEASFNATANANLSAKCKLKVVDLNDPLAQISPCDNIFEVTSRWYNDNPLIIRGPGAGREVTAAAVQSDLNAITEFINAQ